MYKKGHQYGIVYYDKQGEQKETYFTPEKDVTIAGMINGVKSENSDFLKLIKIVENKQAKTEAVQSPQDSKEWQDEANRRINIRLQNLDIYLEEYADAIEDKDDSRISTAYSKILGNIEYLIPALNIKGGAKGLAEYIKNTEFDFENKFKDTADLLDKVADDYAKIYESKKVTEDVKEYRYITNHGIGPGTVPEGTFIRAEALNSGKTAIYLNRPLTDKELKYYDIKPEWIQEAKKPVTEKVLSSSNGKFKKGDIYVNGNGAIVRIQDYTKSGTPQYDIGMSSDFALGTYQCRGFDSDESLQAMLDGNGYRKINENKHMKVESLDDGQRLKIGTQLYDGKYTITVTDMYIYRYGDELRPVVSCTVQSDDEDRRDELFTYSDMIKVMNKPEISIIKESKEIKAESKDLDVSKIAKFLKDSVATLNNTDYTCCEYKLDDDLSIFVGWTDDGKDRYIDSGIMCNHEYLKTDIDWLTQPYYDDTGEVYDTRVELDENSNFEQEAQCFIDSYKTIRELLNLDLLTLEESASLTEDYWKDVEEKRCSRCKKPLEDDDTYIIDGRQVCGYCKIDLELKDEFDDEYYRMHSDEV